MRRFTVLAALLLFGCGDPSYEDLFEDATTVEACEAPTEACVADVEANLDVCEGSEACEAQAVANCYRSRAACIWRIEQPDDPFPCPNQVCGEPCTALDGTQKACGADFTCTDTPQCE